LTVSIAAINTIHPLGCPFFLIGVYQNSHAGIVALFIQLISVVPPGSLGMEAIHHAVSAHDSVELVPHGPGGNVPLSI